MNNEHHITLKSLNWEWVGVGFCFFVVFHLLPTYILGMMTEHSVVVSSDERLVIWLFFGLGIISGYIGYKSKQVSFIEPALSAAGYITVLGFVLPRIFSVGWFSKTQMFHGRLPILPGLCVLLLGFFVASLSAYVGKIARREHIARA